MLGITSKKTRKKKLRQESAWDGFQMNKTAEKPLDELLSLLRRNNQSSNSPYKQERTAKKAAVAHCSFKSLSKTSLRSYSPERAFFPSSRLLLIRNSN